MWSQLLKIKTIFIKKTINWLVVLFFIALFGLGLVYFFKPAVLALGFFILLIVFWRYTEVSFLVLVAYLPFQLALNLAPDIDLLSGRLLILMLFLVWLAKQWLFNKEKIFNLFKNQNVIALLFFLLMALVSVFWAQNQIWASRKILVFISVFPLFFLTSAFIDNWSKAKRLIFIIISSAAFSAIIALTQFLLQFVFGRQEIFSFWAKNIVPYFSGASFAQLVLNNPSWLVESGGQVFLRAIGLFPDPHMLAFYLGLALPFCLVMFVFEKKYRWWLLIAFCLLFTVLLLTFSRGGYLGVLGGLLVVFLAVWPQIRNKERKFIVSVFLMGVVCLAFFGGSVTGRFFSSFNLSEGSNLGRLQIWQNSWEIFKEKPIGGVGLGNYSLALNFAQDYRNPVTSHNLYFDILVELGVFGLLIWLWLFGSAIKISWQNRKSIPVLAVGSLGSLVYFLTHSFFETAIFNPTILAFLMLVLGLVTFLNSKPKDVY
jgi:O-antigen ligase